MFKKKLIAVAGLAVLASAAQAQVTLYGNLDIAVARERVKVDGASAESTTAVESALRSESYFGLKGQEDLGGGLKGIFKLEGTVAADTGSASADAFWNRNAFLGLSGGFGTVKLGRMESLGKLEAGAFNAFGVSAFNPLFDRDEAGAGSWTNTVGYTSPSISGFTVAVQHSFKEGGKGDATNYNAGGTELSLAYAAGPLAASLVYGEEVDADSAIPAASDEKSVGYLLGASYDFGVAKGFAQYGKGRDKEKTVGTTGRNTYFSLGAAVPVTASGVVLASYGQAKQTRTGIAGQAKSRVFSLGYDHNLSKRTTAYAALSYERTKDSLGEVASKSRANLLAVGVKHAF